MKTIKSSDIATYVKNLASDDFMGRKPFTPGEKITVDYLKTNRGNPVLNLGILEDSS